MRDERSVTDRASRWDAAKRWGATIAMALACAATAWAEEVPKSPAPTPASWWAFRNSNQQLGIATSTLPERLEVLWKHPAPDGVAGTAAIVGERVYAPTLSGTLLCLDRGTGELIWSYRSIDDPDPEAFAPGFKASPTVTETAIYIGDEDGVFHCIEPQTGKRQWMFKTGGEIISSAAAVGEKVIFGSYDNNLYCLSAKDGSKIWSAATDGYVNCSPAIEDHYTFVTGCDEHLRVIDIETGKEEVNMPIMSYLIASPAMRDGLLYFGTYNSEVLAVDWRNQKVVWRYRDDKREFPYHSSAAVTDDRVVVGGRDKQIHCIDRQTGKGIWKHTTRAGVDSSPSIAGDRVFVGSSDGNLYELSLADGTEQWKFKIGRNVTAAPAIGEGCLVIGAEGAGEFIYCFGAK